MHLEYTTRGRILALTLSLAAATVVTLVAATAAPTVSTQASSSADLGALGLGQSSTMLYWTAPITLCDVSKTAFGYVPSLVSDATNTTHVAWHNRDEAYYAHEPEGSHWSWPEALPSEFGDVVLDVDASGNAHVVGASRSTPNQLLYSFKKPGGPWSSPESVSAPGLLTPKEIIVHEGDVHVFYLRYIDCSKDSLSYLHRAVSGSWSTALDVSNSPAHTTSWDVALDNSGVIHALFVSSGTGYPFSLRYTFLPQGGTWATPSEIYSTAEMDMLEVQVTLDREDVVHLVTTVGDSGNWQTLHMMKPPGEGWSLSEPPPFGSLVFAPDGTVYAFGRDPQSGLAYSSRAQDGWLPAVHIPGTVCDMDWTEYPVTCDAYLRATVDGHSTLHLIWQRITYQEHSVPMFIHYSTGIAVPEPVSAAISPEGGSLTYKYPGHSTRVDVPPGALSEPAVFTVSYHLPLSVTERLLGMNHFFDLDSEQPSFYLPLTVTVSYSEEVRGTIIPGTEELYRWKNSAWVTEGITLTNRWFAGFSAQVDHLSVFGILGRTNRVYLPVAPRH